MTQLTQRWMFMIGFVWLNAALCESAAPYNPPERIRAERSTVEDHTQRPLRYRPEDTDFVIENGPDCFNRPLYGGSTAFRVDAGDQPEFSLYLPGQAGNLRFGIRTGGQTKWLNQAGRITARYRPGSMVYEIADSLLEDAVIQLTAIAAYEFEGLIVRAQLKNAGRPIQLIGAFGGAGGKRGARSGDIGCESEPISRFFQLRPENCRDNAFTRDGHTFVLKSRIATIAGTLPPSSQLSIADAAYWDDLDALMNSANGPTDTPVLLSTTVMTDGPVFMALRRLGEDDQAFTAEELPEVFAAAERQRRAIAERVVVQTPDPYINAAAAALCAAADGLWDERSGSVMHGAVAWRSAYAGWRGPYANDAIGQHDRSKRHLLYWAGRQNTKSVPGDVMGPDPLANLARSHPAKQSSGDIGGKHYDMNLVYIDALVRHLLWTGDLELAQQLWPVIERHFDWQRRLFRRTFGDDKLPLYEAYAAIWASDDMQFNGGGVSYTSAYNYYHNRFFADIARRLGKDAAPFEQEAELILKGMRQHLWLPDCGWFGEYKDLFGLQAVHPAAGLWTVYHVIDSQAADPMQAWQMTRFVDTQIAQIPVYGGFIPKGQYVTLPTTNWMPYTYSTNNVVMAEVAHTALAYWQAQRPDKAFSLFKGCILDSMYMGQCPGNAGMTTWFDMARGEAQRDFGDAVGTASRALVEGLFGIRPDWLAGRLHLSPGFPDEWQAASIRHPDVTFAYRRNGQTENWHVKPAWSKPMGLVLTVKARGTQVDTLMVNGKSAKWTSVKDAVGAPYIRIETDAAAEYDIKLTWKGPFPAKAKGQPVVAINTALQVQFDKAAILEVIDPQHALRNIQKKSRSFNAVAADRVGHRTVFARLEQDQVTWLEPVEFEIREAFELIEQLHEHEEDSVCFRIQNNTADAIDTLAVVRTGMQWAEMPLQIPAYGLSWYSYLRAEDFQLLPGSNRITVDMGDGRICEGIITNWHLNGRQSIDKCEPVDLDTVYNDRITQIFKNEYVSPRSPYCSLAIPRQGIGSWCNFTKTFDIDDTGLRAAAHENGGFLVLPQGIRFKLPSEPQAPNTVFTSQWDNYPDQITIPLSGKARHLYLLMAGSTNSMQSQFDNGQIIVTYTDGSTERLALRNPTTWWPIDQDYFIDDYGFKRPEPIGPRVDLKTGSVRVLDVQHFKGKGGTIPGGAATVVDLPLSSEKELRSVTLHTLANEVVIGLMSATLIK